MHLLQINEYPSILAFRRNGEKELNVKEMGRNVFLLSHSLCFLQEDKPMTRIMPFSGIHLMKDPHRFGTFRCSEEGRDRKTMCYTQNWILLEVAQMLVHT